MKRVVLKIGSSSLVDQRGRLSSERIELFANIVSHLRSQSGVEVVLVSSGAVAAGAARLEWKEPPSSLHLRQVAAAVGQSQLMQSYQAAFSNYGYEVAQVLLTRRDFALRSAYNNALITLETLLKHGIVPIVNENDTVKWDENSFGDNDLLAALISALIHADLLIVLTDINGLYDKNPKSSPEAKRFNRVEEITQDLLDLAGGSSSKVGTGGMQTKVLAAQKALRMGVPVFIGQANSPEEIERVINDEGDGTYFGSSAKNLAKRKLQWIAFHSAPSGRVIIDQGAEHALLKEQRSLLPAGVSQVDGNFFNRDVIEVFSVFGELLGRGVTNYNSEQLRQVKGLSTKQAKARLNIHRDEVIHRDNWISLIND